MATLKISDLSVGDWVGVRCGTKINAFKVEEIRFSNIIHKYVVLLNNKAYALSITELHPIPITAEILEKNGFVKNGEYNEWSTGNWEDIPFIGISLSRPSMRIKDLGTDIFLDNKVVYVHQLQHALKLAGVDKEINL